MKKYVNVTDLALWLSRYSFLFALFWRPTCREQQRHQRKRGLSGSRFQVPAPDEAACRSAVAADAGDMAAAPRTVAPARPAPASPVVRRNALRFGLFDGWDDGPGSPSSCWHRISWHMLITSSPDLRSDRVGHYAGAGKRDQIPDDEH
jgi:hypothetical protein